MKLLWVLVAGCLLAAPARADEIRVCERRPRVTPDLTCLFDGDSGWQRGTRWHLADVDAPEVDPPNAECRNEQILGFKALDRMRSLMSQGYTVVYLSRRDANGRELVRIEMADGRDAGSELMSAGLAQALPNTGEKWCRQ